MALAAVVGLATISAAHAGDIVVTSPWLRATPRHASVAGGYATITNKGATADRLIGASIPMAAPGEIHEMSMAGGVMRMRRLEKGLPVPAGGTLHLTPGGYHLMFPKPTASIDEGARVDGTLVFEKAGKVPVTFPVAGFGAKDAPN